VALVMDDALEVVEGELVAGRYCIEAYVAKGGMGVVYRAFDRSEGRSVALKRLTADADLRRRTRMFEREFHALAGLKHPRIIEVYDYGVDERGAYYTMELLDGRDLRERAPLPYSIACRYLRDVASSLALLHARNLLHRDLSPRNVRITSDERAKLIDFGALSNFGRCRTVVGTAPCVPPEAVHGHELDQRADLYSLGALSYWVLTGRHAFDVHTLGELELAWRSPPRPPSEFARALGVLPEIPRALDDLVLSLLSRNPLARPASAGEVIARLTTIGDLLPDREPLSALSYLQSGHNVGRARERAELRRRLRAALSGKGSAVMILAEPGMGTAHCLSDLALEARLLGATAVLVDAAAQHGAYGVAEQLVAKLLAAQPEKARNAMDCDADALARFLPRAGSGIPTPRRASVGRDRGGADPRELRLRTQHALHGWLERLSEAVPLLLAVHNLEHADDNSLSLFAALAAEVGERRMLLTLACDPDARAEAPDALASLRALAKSIPLRGLTLDEVRALVSVTFGDIPNTERLVSWLHGLTSGKPQACHDLLLHLTERGVIRFTDGVWTLPHELSPHDLPADLGQVLEQRIAQLSADARRLALALCVHNGPLSVERCLALAELERVPSPLRCVTELEQRGILIADEENLRFSHTALLEAARRQLSAAERLRLHAQLGMLLSRASTSEDPEAQLVAAFHLLRGGDEQRGAHMLAEAGRALAFDPDGIPSAIPALEAALAVFSKQHRSARVLARVLGPLVLCGFYRDRGVLERYGDQAADLMQRALGLRFARRLRPLLGGRLATWLGLLAGLGDHVLAYGPRRGALGFRESLTIYVTAVAALTGHGAITLDAPRARRLAELLEPFRFLGSDHGAAITYRYLHALSRMPEDRVAKTLVHCRAVLARVEAAQPIDELPADARELLRGTLHYTCGTLETFREDPQALRHAELLDGMGAKLFELFANQIRANYYGLRGEEELAESFRRKVELYAVQAGSGWQADLWSPASAAVYYNLAEDLVGLRRVTAQLERLAGDVPSLRAHLQLAVAAHCSALGDADGAYRTRGAVMGAFEPRGFISWSAAQAAQMRDLAALGKLEEARQLGLDALALYDAEDRSVSALITPLVARLAVVEAQLGELDIAQARLTEYCVELGERGGPITRGTLHEAQLQLALLAGDMIAAREQLAHMDRWFRPTDNPALIARCERRRRQLDVRQGNARAATETDARGHAASATELVRQALQSAASDEQRWQRALTLLLEHVGGTRGCLARHTAGRLHCLAAVERGELTDQERARLLSAIACQERSELEATVAMPVLTSNPSIASGLRETEDLERVLLFTTRAGDGVPGVALIGVRRGAVAGSVGALLQALGEALCEPSVSEAVTHAPSGSAQ
jgi:hypothetical protein